MAGGHVGGERSELGLLAKPRGTKRKLAGMELNKILEERRNQIQQELDHLEKRVQQLSEELHSINSFLNPIGMKAKAAKLGRNAGKARGSTENAVKASSSFDKGKEKFLLQEKPQALEQKQHEIKREFKKRAPTRKEMIEKAQGTLTKQQQPMNAIQRMRMMDLGELPDEAREINQRSYSFELFKEKFNQIQAWSQVDEKDYPPNKIPVSVKIGSLEDPSFYNAVGFKEGADPAEVLEFFNLGLIRFVILGPDSREISYLPKKVRSAIDGI